MSAARKSKSAPAGALTRADLIVRAARGYERPDGGIAWSGVLWVRDVPIVNFRNDGDGGCNVYQIMPAVTVDARAVFAEVEALAKREFPQYKFEQVDHLVGELWDAAMLRAQS